jgi:hypothetical protein
MISTKELAERLGVSPRYVRKIAGGIPGLKRPGWARSFDEATPQFRNWLSNESKAIRARKKRQVQIDRLAALRRPIRPNRRKSKVVHNGNMVVTIRFVRTAALAMMHGKIQRDLTLGRAALNRESAIADTLPLYEWLKTLHEA